METLEDEFKGMKENWENCMELMIKQHSEEKLHKRDNVAQGTHEDKDSVHVEKTSINKHTLGGFDPYNGANYECFPKVIQIRKTDMRKFMVNTP